MGGGLLEPAATTALNRTTVHAQYNGRAFGVRMLNNLIPIVLNVPVPGSSPRRAILVYGDVPHRYSPYEDYGVRKKCCIKVLNFNIQHYFKCYLPNASGEIDEENGPFTYNCCRKCGVTLEDACGHLIQVKTFRQYNVDKYIHRAPSVLQPGESSELLKWRERNC